MGMKDKFHSSVVSSTVELSRVGVASASAVCIEFTTSSRRLPTTADENLETEHVENLSYRVESS